MSSFKLINTTKYCNRIPIRKYVSEKTGLTVILVDIEGPICNGYFLTGTETNDDDGIAYSLERIIFSGSELYPYPELLKTLVGRGYGYANAATTIDKTYYMLTTIGKEGFLSILPIYLDHITHPTLTDASFKIQVHHVTGNGKDGGLVYCEMEAKENTCHTVAYTKLMREIFPDSGYKSIIGGSLHNLRTSTSIEKIRDYHKAVYRPENLFIIITGQILPEEVFKSLEVVDDRIYQKEKLPPFQRPWQTPIAPINETKTFTVYFPSNIGKSGFVIVGFLGPKPISEMVSFAACKIFMKYISELPLGPLIVEFLHVSEPFASEIKCGVREMSTSMLYITFEDVPVKKINLIEEKMIDFFFNIISLADSLEMAQIKIIIDRTISELLNGAEKNAHMPISRKIFQECIYGNDDDNLDYRFNLVKHYEEVRGFDEDTWIDLIKKYFVHGPYIFVKSFPSLREKRRKAKEEQERIEKQIKDLGETGLLLKNSELFDAIKINETRPPNEMLKIVKIPSVDDIKFHYISKVDINTPGLHLNTIPIYTEAYDVHTNFVFFAITMNTANLPSDLRPFVPLLLEVITESPIRVGNVIISYEQTTTGLRTSCVSTSIQFGLEKSTPFSCGVFSHTVSIKFQVEAEKYMTGATWMVDLLGRTEFTIHKIKHCARKILKSIAAVNNDGDNIALGALQLMLYNEDSNVIHNSMIKQYRFLSVILRLLENQTTAKSVRKKLNKVRGYLLLPSNLALHIAADWKLLSRTFTNVSEPWTKIARKSDTVYEFNPVPDWKLIKTEEDPTNCNGAILGMSSIDTAFLYHSSPGLNDLLDNDLNGLLVFIEYLTQCGGPFWNQIRLQGFAESFNLLCSHNEGLLLLHIYRASDVVAAFKEAKKVIEDQLCESALWDQSLIESAKSSIIFKTVISEESVSDLVRHSLLSSFRKLPINFYHLFIKCIDKVTEQDLVRVGKKYLQGMFSNKSKISIICHPDKLQDILNGFKEIGYDLNS